MTQRRLFALALMVPALAVLFVGVVWFAGRWSLPRWSARIWVPKTAPNHLILRAQVRGFPSGSLPRRPLEIEAVIQTSQGEVHRLSGQSTAQGFAEWDVWLPAASLSYGVQLRHVGGDDAVLVRGEWSIDELTAPLTIRHTPTRVRLRPSNREVEFTLRHGAFTVPIPDELQVSWHPDAGETQAVEVELSGASDRQGGRVFQWVNGQKTTIRPTEHLVEVTVRQTEGHGELSSGFGILPVVPGAIAARLDSDGVVSVVSPVPREEAFLAFATLQETISIATVPLRELRDEQTGTVYLGRLALPEVVREVASREQVWAVTSSEFDLESEAQLGLPLTELPYGGHSTRFRWGKVMDGAEEQRQSVQAQRTRWQWTAWGGLLVACAIELGLVVVHARGASRQVHAEVAVDQGIPYWLVIGCVVLGFSGLASLFSMW